MGEKPFVLGTLQTGIPVSKHFQLHIPRYQPSLWKATSPILK